MATEEKEAWLKSSPWGPFHLERLIEHSNIGLVMMDGEFVMVDGELKTAPGQREVAFALARYVSTGVRGFEGLWACFPSYGTVADGILRCEKFIQNGVDALVEAGYMTRIQRPRKSNVFIFAYDLIYREAIANFEAKQELKGAKHRAQVEAYHKVLRELNQDDYGTVELDEPDGSGSDDPGYTSTDYDGHPIKSQFPFAPSSDDDEYDDGSDDFDDDDDSFDTGYLDEE